MTKLTIDFRVRMLRDDVPSKVQAQARRLVIDALEHYEKCPMAYTKISGSDVMLIAEMLNDPPAELARTPMQRLFDREPRELAYDPPVDDDDEGSPK